MIGIGPRLREERERLGLTQRAFGEVGGVEPNAQGKYESGERWPKADYLASVARQGADVLYILTGRRAPLTAEQADQSECDLLAAYRQMPEAARQALLGMALSVAELAEADAAKGPAASRGR